MKQQTSFLFQKQRMAEAFKTVSREKNFSEITISELLEVSGLEREVFEQYFDDLHDLLRWILEQESVAVIRQYQLLSRLEDIIYYTVDYVEKNPHITCCIQDPWGREALKEFFTTNLYRAVEDAVYSGDEKGEISQEYKKFLADFYTEALAGSLVTFLARSGEHRFCPLEKYTHYLAVTLQETIAGALQPK